MNHRAAVAWPATPARALATALLIALWPAQWTQAQSAAALAPAGPGAAPCNTSADLAPAQLYGRWQLSLWSPSATPPAPGAHNGAITFERHPEFPDSVRGRLQRQSSGQTTEALVSGDVINGEFNLDESADGQRTDAVWTGNVSPTGCNKEIRGVRLPAEGQTGEAMNFALTKAPGWE